MPFSNKKDSHHRRRFTVRQEHIKEYYIKRELNGTLRFLKCYIETPNVIQIRANILYLSETSLRADHRVDFIGIGERIIFGEGVTIISPEILWPYNEKNVSIEGVYSWAKTIEAAEAGDVMRGCYGG